MYDTGVANFLAAASNPNRLIDTRATLKSAQDVVWNTEDIVSYKISDASVAGKYFTPGNFVASTLEMSLNAMSTKVSQVEFNTMAINAVIVEAGISSLGSMIYVPMGVFYIDDDGISTENDGHLTLKATDIPPVMSTQFNSSILPLPCTVQDALNTIQGRIGISIHVEGDFPNLTAPLSETFELSSTYREALRYIAETLGAFVHMRRDGSIGIEQIFKGVVNMGCTLDDNYLFSVNQQETTVKSFQYISIKASEADVGVTQQVAGIASEKEYAIINNPFTYGHPEDFLAGLVQPTSFTPFHPATIAFHGRPDLDVGDVLEYVYKGAIYWLPVCMHTFEYNGGFTTTVEGIGTDSLAVSSNKSNKQVSTDITALRQNVNSLVRDLTQTQSEIVDINGDITRMSDILQTVEKLQTQVSSLEGDLDKVSTLTQTAKQLRLDIQTVTEALAETTSVMNQNQATLLTYFDFQSDGLTIGVNTSTIKLRLANNRIQFLKDDAEVAYLSEGQLYVTDAHFLKSLILGNFELTPRTNGNLSLRRR